ncbi:MAG: (d)CMP kinase [Melioribacteraceae bacterium]|nr:(d)CMP kinase [Melioribacteraceae bacterium]MCF8265306.1 (d)CMP kinase [Melioribacteraceae bacterium]MCF8412767.1 (d)CMP kinase [Melioribacteraceae bacterium]
MSNFKIIAIDGPSGSGKSTIAKKIAERYGYLYVDTGAMYRAVTYEILKKNVINDIEKMISLVADLDVELKFENGLTRVFVNREEVTDAIRSSRVTERVSEVSAISEIREKLVDLQRGYANQQGLVLEGRDITTVVFPNADLKIFLTASIDERASRRLLELLAKEEDVDFEFVKKSLIERDRKDSTREISPLKKAGDAIEVDTTNLSIEGVVDKISLLIESNIENLKPS